MGIGASGYSQYVENVVEQTPCYDWMVGEKSGLFRAYMQAYNIVLFALILLGTVTMISKKKVILICGLSEFTGAVRLCFIFLGGTSEIFGEYCAAAYDVNCSVSGNLFI